MESHIESGMKSVLQVVDIKTLLIVILDGFNGRQLALVDLVY